MKKIVYLFIASLAFTAVSCDKDFEEVNTTQNSSLTTDPNLLLGGAIIATQNTIYNAQIGADMGLCWAQHWSKVQYNDEEKYIPRRALMNSMWTVMYSSVIAEAKEAYTLAGAAGNTNLQGASLIIQANAFQIVTDLYGPCPFTEAVVPGIVKPVYDSEEVVYEGILALLDEAEVLLANGTGDFTPSADYVYGGDFSKWRKFGASLKLKALMRISSKRSVSSDLQALVNSGLLFSSNSDTAQLIYTSSQPDANPIYETIVYGGRTEYKMSSVLVDKLAGTNDPRLAVYAQKNNANAYVGNVPGVENSGNYNAFSSPGTFYLNPTLPGIIISNAQVQFLLAEAASKGFISGGIDTAREYYLAGIRANMTVNGISPAAADAYIAQSGIDFFTTAQANERIGYQTWLALYGQGIETWTEWRRTGFPALSPVFDAAIPQIPSRFYYSTDSQNTNNANYTAAAAMLSNGDTMLSKVWWMN
ncbi:SusD/RagB family nutrient-binding outer membrane lipoprotein [Flavobacterium sp.]|uniref:SusD/RagB family nutrient-binding outer membrane lipoprotein n=1 Tax=Flavobacterium sp. TaxID=239 RepID=UPI0026138A87|nr:SusD/RagB family nutrient-binding outer membrane lipoprotein [Flavobacterium sp.]MDD2987267.1 SusD/RagB family nutrient-binding outer membrane lipoprotein [Flavobacterium sp.]